MKKILSILFCAALIFTPSANAVNSKCSDKIEITENKGLYIIRIPKERNSKVYPYVTRFLTLNRDVYDQTGAELVINAGYFDPNNKGTSSYVVINGETVLDPTTNESLMNNKALLPNLGTIINRTEYRVLNCNGETK